MKKRLIDYLLIMDIRKEYEKICPMTTWSDEEILNYIDRQIESSDSSSFPIEIIKVESVDEFIRENHCRNLEDIITELRGVIK